MSMLSSLRYPSNTSWYDRSQYDSRPVDDSIGDSRNLFNCQSGSGKLSAEATEPSRTGAVIGPAADADGAVDISLVLPCGGGDDLRHFHACGEANGVSRPDACR